MTWREFVQRPPDERLVAYYGDETNDENADLLLARNANDDIDAYVRLLKRPSFVFRVARADDDVGVEGVSIDQGQSQHIVFFLRPSVDDEFPWHVNDTIRLFSVYAHDYVASLIIDDVFEPRNNARLMRVGYIVARVVDVDSARVADSFFRLTN